MQIYSQVYTAVARTLLRFDDICKADNWYSPEWHRLITRVAIYESKGFTRVVHFGLTPQIIADLWLDDIRAKPATAKAMAITARTDRGPWDPITVMETLPLAILHCRIKFGDWGAGTPGVGLMEQSNYCATNYLQVLKEDKVVIGKFAQSIYNFETTNPDPKLILSPNEHRQMSTAPGAKQIGLEL